MVNISGFSISAITSLKMAALNGHRPHFYSDTGSGRYGRDRVGLQRTGIPHLVWRTMSRWYADCRQTEAAEGLSGTASRFRASAKCVSGAPSHPGRQSSRTDAKIPSADPLGLQSWQPCRSARSH